MTLLCFSLNYVRSRNQFTPITGETELFRRFERFLEGYFISVFPVFRIFRVW